MKQYILILISLFSFMAAPQAAAQIEMQLQPVRKDYVAGESPAFNLTIVNQTDATYVLKNTPGRPWLNIQIFVRGQGLPLTPIATPVFPATTITPGSSRTFRLGTKNFYRMGETGSYHAIATIRMPDGFSTYSSNKAMFSVESGAELNSFRIQARGKRLQLSLRMAQIEQQLWLFGQVRDLNTSRIVNTCLLGHYLNFMKPIAKLDGAQNMHVLCQSSPTIFTYAVMNTKGDRASHKLYSRVGGSMVDLINTGRGVMPVGLTPYVAPKADNQNIRKASDRPF